MCSVSFESNNSIICLQYVASWWAHRHYKIAVTQAHGEITAVWHLWIRVCAWGCLWVRVWGNRSTNRKFPSSYVLSRSDDITAAECVWLEAPDKLSENNEQRGLLTYGRVCFDLTQTQTHTRKKHTWESDVINTVLSLTSQSQQDTHVHRCLTAYIRVETLIHM